MTIHARIGCLGLPAAFKRHHWLGVKEKSLLIADRCLLHISNAQLLRSSRSPIPSVFLSYPAMAHGPQATCLKFHPMSIARSTGSDKQAQHPSIPLRHA
eukprot:scaffold1551_cov169-Pinguiococcus_pyrenoidosus.AAC.1